MNIFVNLNDRLLAMKNVMYREANISHEMYNVYMAPFCAKFMGISNRLRDFYDGQPPQSYPTDWADR